MQQRPRATLRRTTPLLVLAAALLALVPLSARACGDHAHDEGLSGGAPTRSLLWDKEVEIHGRRRSLLSTRGRRCGTLAPHPHTIVSLERELAVHRAREADVLPTGSGPRTYTIPVYVYVVLPTDGSARGNVSDDTVRQQVALMNTAYGTNANNAGLAWKFSIAAIKRVAGPNMCDNDGEAKVKALNHVTKPSVLNLYFTDLSLCGLLGYSTWPWDARGAPGKDGVVIHFDTMPGGKYKPYNMGRTTVHETGHWLGLYHTFQNGCTNGGDQVDDTPYSASPTEGCPTRRDSCSQPGTDPISNFMDYTDDKCMKVFTPVQHQRAESMFRLHRGGVSSVG